jgi:hypothetical protein|tara:strand:+ start:903 stop:1049 length:147 start_codon:yes stop_codon:yes gene_type:complete
MKHRMALFSIIMFYRKQIAKGKCKPNGATYLRMKELEERYFRVNNEEI